MTRRVPIVPTMIVAAAVAAMIALGVWQMQRREWKEGLLARYEAAADLPPLVRGEIVSFPLEPYVSRNPTPEELHYRRAVFDCSRVVGWRAIAGRNADDQPGYVYVAQCETKDWASFDGPALGGEVVLGWSRGVEEPEWSGGEVTGMIAPGGELGWRLVADPPLAGLQANAQPDPNDLPNNHLMYAGQWFFFALTALVIYVLALRKRWRGDALK